MAAVRTVRPGPGSLYPPCAFQWLTGWLCPGCGALRALRALTDGDLERAWSSNPAFVIFLGALLCTTLLPGPAAFSGDRGASSFSGAAIAIAIGLFWIGRNF